MTKKLAVGIDYGDLEIRAAFAQGGTAHPAPLPGALEAPVYFDPYANISSLGVGFPSILQTVGSDTSFALGNRTETAEALVERRLASLYKALVEAGERAVGQSVLAVPAALSQQRRRVLLSCAERAGFTGASLIEAGAAAALGDHGDREKASTTVVYRLSYGDCEVSLVRLTRGRCRVVGSSVVTGVSGQMFDALVMESVVLALREKRVFLGLRQFTAQDWLEFRHIAETARIALATRPEVAVKLPAQLVEEGAGLRLRLDAAGLSSRLAPLVERTVETVVGLLEQNDLTPENVDRFLLVGGAARMPPVSDYLSRAFESLPRAAPGALVSFGALLEACRLTGQPIQLPEIPADPEVAPDDSGGADLSPIRVSERPASEEAGETRLVHVDELPSERPSVRREPAAERPAPEVEATEGTEGGSGAAEVRRLLEEGRIEEAEALLEAMDREIRSLRSDLEASKPTEAQRLIQQARALLASGNDAQAVSLSHKAYDEDPADPAVFAAMMKIHTEVGLALDKPEEYEDSLRILRCAHNHDQTDRSIHRAIAERHLRHAAAMRKRNNRAKALEAVQAGLTFEPKHPELNRLLKELTAEAAATDQ